VYYRYIPALFVCPSWRFNFWLTLNSPNFLLSEWRIYRSIHNKVNDNYIVPYFSDSGDYIRWYKGTLLITKRAFIQYMLSRIKSMSVNKFAFIVIHMLTLINEQWIQFKSEISSKRISKTKRKPCTHLRNYVTLVTDAYHQKVKRLLSATLFEDNKRYLKSNIILIFDIKENEWTYNRQLIYQQIYIMNV